MAIEPNIEAIRQMCRHTWENATMHCNSTREYCRFHGVVSIPAGVGEYHSFAITLAAFLILVIHVNGTVTRRSFLAVLVGLLGANSAKAGSPKASFPPVPLWHPSFTQPLDRVADRISYYVDRRKDFVVFHNGTCVLLADGLTEKQAVEFSRKVLSDILSFHPDMNPTPMDDGNILVRYNHPAVNVVLHDVAQAHWAEIESRHLDGLTPSEVLITPLGPNKFDAFGKQALLGRAFMFMDAQRPEISKIIRH